MKKLKKIKLNQFSQDELDQRKMNALKGGCNCTIGNKCSSCGNPCQCNDYLSGGIISANSDYLYSASRWGQSVSEY